MAISISPVISITEIDATGSVPAVSTTEAAIAGVFHWGPVMERTLISNETELVAKFGKPSNFNGETFFTAASYLAYANALYVTRVVDDGALNAGVDAQVLTKEDALEISDTAFIGRYPGALANNLMVSMVGTADAYESAVTEAWIRNGESVMKVYGADGLDVSIGDMIRFGDIGGGSQDLMVTNITNASESTPSPIVTPNVATVQALTGGETTIVKVDRLNRYVAGDFITIANATGYTAINGTHEVLSVSGKSVEIDFDSSEDDPSTYTANSATSTRVVDPSWVTASVTTYTVTLNGKYRLSDDVIYGTVQRRWGYSNAVARSPLANTVNIVVTDVTGAITGRAGSIVESYPGVSTVAGTKSEDGTNIYFKDVINERSAWIYATGAVLSLTAKPLYLRLINGADGDNEATIAVGYIAQGYDLYASAEEVNVSFIMQGKARGGATLANYILSNVVGQRFDCMATFTPPMEVVVNNQGNELSGLADFKTAIGSSSYYVMDHTYKYTYDKYNDVMRWVPVNGDIAGLMARVAPWESPAGYRKGNIKNAVKLSFNPTSKAVRDRLYELDICPVISQIGHGTLLFGDKTGLNSTSAFSRINYRRLFIYVEKAIATFARDLLFDNNNEFTQNRFRNSVEPFLRDIQGQNGLIDFRVDCGPTVNTPDVVDAWTFRGNIYLKGPRSINYIDLKFVAVPTGVSFEEIISEGV